MSDKKILVVEDETDLREALTTALSQAGFISIGAEDGEKGLALALLEKPDLILLDISMPKMNGHQVLNKLRRDAWGANVPVLFLTNFDDATNISQGFELKGDDYIIKSNASLEEIIKRAREFLVGYHSKK